MTSQKFSIGLVSDGFIFKNNLSKLFPLFIFIPKTGIGLPKQGFVFTVKPSDVRCAPSLKPLTSR